MHDKCPSKFCQGDNPYSLWQKDDSEPIVTSSILLNKKVLCLMISVNVKENSKTFH